MIKLYNVEGKYLYEILDDYKQLDNKDEIFSAFTDKIWIYVMDKIKVEPHAKFIKYKTIPKHFKTDTDRIFEKYKKIYYYTRSGYNKYSTNWYDIISFKIAHLYFRYFNLHGVIDDSNIKGYVDLLREPKRLYFRYISGNLEMSASQLKQHIKCSLRKAQNLKKQYSKQLMKEENNEYRQCIDKTIRKAFDNYIPLDKFEDKTKFVLDIDFVIEDNFTEKYICKWLECEMKQFQKQYYGIKRLKKDEKLKRCQDCGRLFVIKKKNNRTIRCNACRDIHKKELRKAQNQRYYNRTKIK